MITNNKRFTLKESDIYNQKDVIFDNNIELPQSVACDLLNEFYEENGRLKQLLKLIAMAETFTKVNSVKEVLRNEIKGIDTVTEYSAEAWKDYCILSNFFKEEYGEHWDNYD